VTPGERAESLVDELGISEPGDLDVEAIAYDSGVSVAYADLKGCDATLVGLGGRAIATIRPSTEERQRFSIAHEMGHWSEHRGRSFTCRVDDVDTNLTSDKKLEREADQYAAHLLLPKRLFKPQFAAVNAPTFKHVVSIANTFKTSILATSLRLTYLSAFPLILTSYGPAGFRWQVRSKDVPTRWWLKAHLHEDSFAVDYFQRGTLRGGPGKQPADVWFDNDDADQYEVTEEYIAGHGGTALILLTLADEEMLSAGFDRDLWTGKIKRR
jgi:Zn-dependent peptidase ImmA (M78 family)